ncbi:hypothetical protein HYT23_05230 [Candidatus Pacearchaeota archaeon]|nr:hypothetical protein [Candidatus Pacearchaeota archaeon]
MKITVQIKFGSERQRIVRFGNFRYLVYICSLKEDDKSMDEFNAVMSKELIVPPGRIHYKGKQGDLYVFDVD